MKTTGDKRKSRSKVNSEAMESEAGPRFENNIEHVATAAYYKAEARGFSPGSELEDWLSAEVELSKGEGGSGRSNREISP
ncbi:MAG: DUF2934 domain-containing protein [Azonexus sp.]|nr:DUF2934 domain-containing protein [Azonexus sp.]